MLLHLANWSAVLSLAPHWHSPQGLSTSALVHCNREWSVATRKDNSLVSESLWFCPPCAWNRTSSPAAVTAHIAVKGGTSSLSVRCFRPLLRAPEFEEPCQLTSVLWYLIVRAAALGLEPRADSLRWSSTLFPAYRGEVPLCRVIRVVGASFSLVKQRGRSGKIGESCAPLGQ